VLELKGCSKSGASDMDKALPPAETVRRVSALFAAEGGILAEVRRVDTGRLGIPVYLSVCGHRARKVMPTRKQMGKGPSPDQARASALMELAERFSFFSFWAGEERFERLTWSAASARFPGRLLPLSQVLASVGEDLAEHAAARVLDLAPWRFFPVTDLAGGREVLAPLDWFKALDRKSVV